jgi:hypothetical protein
LKDNGFTVLISKKYPFEWLHFEKDGNFGYVGPASFYGYNFSSVHKPCKEYGTGLGTASDADLTIQNAIDAITAKRWNNVEVNHYTSIENFMNHSNNQWAEYYIF